MTRREVTAFQEKIWQYYAAHSRHDLPWRLPEADGSFDAYKILVSEVMLQQTQVPRVVLKFNDFIAQFPTFTALAGAPLSEVLKSWNGLGYNRRAKFLWQAAQAVSRGYGGQLPRTQEALVKLPGIGPNTAGAILAYTHNQPVVFLETNVRTVFIHHFFDGQDTVSDKDIVPLLHRTLPAENARHWYWALMDYGTHLKKTVGNAARRSKSYARQSAFEGSRRQIRGKVLRLLAERQLTKAQLVKQILDERLDSVLADLEKEGFITQTGNAFTLRAV